MKRPDAGQVRSAASKILVFLPRADLLELRGRRNYNRYMMVVKRFVAPDGPERAQWQREAAQEVIRDAEWHRRHGPVAGGAKILRWHQCERGLEPHTPVRRGTATGRDLR